MTTYNLRASAFHAVMTNDKLICVDFGVVLHIRGKQVATDYKSTAKCISLRMYTYILYYHCKYAHAWTSKIVKFTL